MKRQINFYISAAIYIISAFLILYRPGFFDGAAYLGVGSDPSLYMWMFRFLPDALIHLHNPLVISNAWAPYGLNISQATTTPGVALLAWPMTAFFGPVISFNIVSILSPALAAFTAFLFASVYTRYWLPAFISGWLFGFSTYEFASLLGHLQVDFIAFVPLAFFAVAARSQNRLQFQGYIFLLTFSLIFEFLISLEIFVMQALFITIFTVFAHVSSRKNIYTIFKLKRDNVLFGLILSYIFTAMIVSPFIFIFFAHHTHFPINTQTFSQYSTNLANLIVPTPVTWIGGRFALSVSRNFAGNFSEEMGYIGAPLLVILACAVFNLRRVRSAQPLIALLAAGLVCSLGPELHVLGATIIPLPWALIDKLPFLGDALPSRLMLFALLAISGLVALWIERIHQHRVVAMGALACATIFTLPSAVNHKVDWWRSHVPTARLFKSDRYKVLIRGGQIVLFLPFSWENGNAMFWQLETNGYFRMTNGYGDFVPPGLSGWPVVRMLEDNMHPPGFTSAFNEFAKAENIQRVIVPKNQISTWGHALTASGWIGNNVGRLTVFRLPKALRANVASVSAAQSKLAFDRRHLEALWRAASCLLNRNIRTINPKSAVAAGCLNAEFASDTESKWDRIGGWLGRYGHGIGVGEFTTSKDAERLASLFGTDAEHIYFPYPHVLRPKHMLDREGQLLIVAKPSVFLSRRYQ